MTLQPSSSQTSETIEARRERHELEAADYGFEVRRSYSAIDDPSGVSRDSDGIWRIRAGARVRVTVVMETGERRYHVALVDRLPAGFEPADVGLGGARSQVPSQDRWSGWWTEHRNLRDDRAEGFVSLLHPGSWVFEYIVEATIPGEFTAPPPKAEEMYQPETFGRAATDKVVVEARK